MATEHSPCAAVVARESYRLGDLVVDVDGAAIWRGGERIVVPPRTFELLVALLRRHPGTVRRRELLATVWPDEHVSDQALSHRVMVLRRALGDRAGQPVYVHGERGFGYRLFGPVTRLDGDEPAVATRRRQVSVLVGVAVVVAAGVMLGLRAWLPAVAAEGRAVPLTVAVRPQLGVTGEAQPLARELANSIASSLRGVRGVRVVRWGGIGGKPRLWLEGACRETAKGLELQLQVVDGARGAVWVHRVQGDAQEILGQEAAIVAAVTRAVRARAEPAAAAPGEAEVSPQLRRLCVRGSLWWLSWTSGGLRAAGKAWAEAIAIAPGHAPAHAGLSLTRSVESLLGYVPPSQAESSARDHARRALELDPALLEAHLATGLVRLVFDRDAAGARGAMREAAEAFPEDPESAMARALVAQAQGRVEESLQLLSRATDTDPHATGAFYLEGRSLQMEADWSGAAAAYRKALDLEPALVLARRRLAECLAADHREAEALAALDARASRPGEAPEATLRTLWRRACFSREQGLEERLRACVLCGERGAATAALAAGVKDGLPFLAFVPHEPLLAPLRESATEPLPPGRSPGTSSASAP